MLAFCGILILLLVLRLKASPDSSRTSETCTTEWALSLDGPVSIVTRTQIQTHSNIVVERVTPTITRRPETATVTISTDDVSLITVPQNIRTISELTTQTAVVAVTVTITITAFVGDERNYRWSIIVPVTPTVTIPTPSGFLRPTAAPLMKREIKGLQGRNAKVLDAVDARLDGLVLRQTNHKLQKRAPVPTKVVCTDLITITLASTRTITGTSTVTIDESVPTHTVYAGLVESTVVPADALVSTMLTVIKPTLTTVFVTKSVEVHIPFTTTVPATTLYDACLELNMLNNVHGEIIGKVWDGPAFFAVEHFEEAQTPYDCCAACIVHPNCGGASFKPGGDLDQPRPRCRGLVSFKECDPGNLVGYFDRRSIKKGGEKPEEGIQISSSHCGHMEQGDV